MDIWIWDKAWPGLPIKGWAWSKHLKELLKEVIVSSTYIYRDITHMKRQVFIVEIK